MSLWMKSYGVTIQMKPIQQYFHMVLLGFLHFTKWRWEMLLTYDFGHPWEWKG